MRTTTPTPHARATRRWPRAVAAAAACLVSTGCGSAVPHPTAADAAWASAQGTPTSRSALAQGRSLYVARCSGCHALPTPAPPPPEGWPRAVAHMAPKARLAPAQARLIVAYLKAVSRPGRAGDGGGHAAPRPGRGASPPPEPPPPRASPTDDARGWSTGL